MAGLALTVLAVPAVAQEAEAPSAPDQAQEQKLEGDARALYAIGVSIGDQLQNLQVTAEEVDTVVRGLRHGALDKEVLVERSEFQQLIPAFQQSRQQAMLEQEKAASQAFLEKEAAKEASVQLDTGVIITHLQEGEGKSPDENDEVKVHYRGTGRTGEEFDSSLGGDPAVFPLNQVIECWTSALQEMKAGGKARIVCPSDTAYGDRGNQVIKPGAALVFEVELLEVREKEGPEAGGAEPAEGAAGGEGSQAEQPETP
jgi:FKBP-type peptidyl-prolyl cis-trans isomerase